MKMYVDLTDNELRALRTCLAYSNRCCLSCCVYPEMQQRKIECHNCEFTKNVDKVIKKFNNFQPLADHDKQVRNDVLCELMNMLGDRAELIDCGGGVAEFMFTTYDLSMCVEEILDQLQGESSEK